MPEEDSARQPDEILALLGVPPAEETEAKLEQASDRAREIGKRVRAARRRAGLSAVNLAALIDISADKLSKIENGRRQISSPEIPRMATALGITTDYLLNGTPTAVPALAYRLSRQTGDTSTSHMQERASTLLKIEARLTRFAVLPPHHPSPGGARVQRQVSASFPAPPRTRPEAELQGGELAGIVRSALDLGSAEIGDLPGFIEMHFAADVALSPVGGTVAGLCAHTEEQALLLANSTFSTGHVRFALAHELGHHLLRDPREVIEEENQDMFSSSYVERRASAFAAQLLLPAKGVHEALMWLGVEADDVHHNGIRGRLALGYLMAKYGVSMTCTLYRLAELQVISFQRAEHLKGKLLPGQLLAEVSYLTPSSVGLAEASHEVRVPARLLGAALTAARNRHVGMNTMSSLLEREDDDQLYDEIMGSVTDDENEEPLLP